MWKLTLKWSLKRTHGCGELRKNHAGQEVILNGWIHSIRKHGRIIFLLLRDRSGIVQAVITAKNPHFKKAQELDREFVIGVKGLVKERPPRQVNPEMPTGEVEVEIKELEVISRAKPIPIPIWDEELMKTTSEANRLTYRYLDLRRERMQRNLVLRANVAKALREFYDSKGFIEIETPYLARSTPEGARDFLVPSRLYPRKFYALTQSPQIFKQLLMIAGFERYYQLARCFRDEDPRADRQPEFTQFDMEMSFVKRDDVLEIVEESMKYVFKEVLGQDLLIPFPRISYFEAIERFGIDKPDIRFGYELQTVNELRTLFNAGKDSVVRMLKIKGLHKLGENLRKIVESSLTTEGVEGVAYAALPEEGNILSNLPDDLAKELISTLELEKGEGAVVAWGKYLEVSEGLGTLRNLLGRILGLAEKGKYAFLWVIDFPLFEVDKETGRIVPRHHPFTSPKPEDIDLLDAEPLKVRAQAYDLVLNGYEVAGGSIRIHERDLQEKMFKLLGLSREDMLDRYGFFLEALDYGAPPHGGIAFGLDRLVAIMAGEESIREVIAFPKNKEMFDPLTKSPSHAPPEYLQDLKWLKIE